MSRLLRPSANGCSVGSLTKPFIPTHGPVFHWAKVDAHSATSPTSIPILSVNVYNAHASHYCAMEPGMSLGVFHDAPEDSPRPSCEFFTTRIEVSCERPASIQQFLNLSFVRTRVANPLSIAAISVASPAAMSGRKYWQCVPAIFAVCFHIVNQASLVDGCGNKLARSDAVDGIGCNARLETIVTEAIAARARLAW